AEGYFVQVGVSIPGKVGFLGKILSQQAVGVFVRCSLPGAVWITEIDFHIRSYREGLVFGHFQPAVPRQRASQWCWKLRICRLSAATTAAVTLLRSSYIPVRTVAFDS